MIIWRRGSARPDETTMQTPPCGSCRHIGHCNGDCTPEGRAGYDALFAIRARLQAKERAAREQATTNAAPTEPQGDEKRAA